MRLVVAARVEAREVARVVRVERVAGGELADEGGDAVAFFNRAAGRWKTILPGMERDKKRLVFEVPAAGTP